MEFIIKHTNEVLVSHSGLALAGAILQQSPLRDRLSAIRLGDRKRPTTSHGDVLLSMIYPFDPAWRALTHLPGRSMWTFPDDYPPRVGDALYQAVPALRRAGS